MSCTISKLFRPIDGNILGKIHGGNFIALSEEAGTICCSKYCSTYPVPDTKAGMECQLVRIEYLDFLKPMSIGEAVEVYASIVFASSNSMAVKIDGYAYPVSNVSEKCHTFRTLMWFKVAAFDKETKCVKYVEGAVAPMPVVGDYSDIYVTADALIEIEKQLNSSARLANAQATMQDEWSQVMHVWADKHDGFDTLKDKVPYTELCTTSTVKFMSLIDCFPTLRTAIPGVLLKHMDEVAAHSAFRHLRTYVNSARVHSIEFYCNIPTGSNVVTIARPVFCSERTIEIEIVCSYFNAFTRSDPVVACSGYFVIVALSPEFKPTTIVPFVPATPGEVRRFEAGKKRYEIRKALLKASHK